MTRENIIVLLIEGGVMFEVLMGILGMAGGLIFGKYYDITISEHIVFYNTMIRVSIGLVTMSAIIVNLLGAISLRTYRIASSSSKISKMSFASIIALLASCCIGLLLIVLDQSLDRIFRYILTGGWGGLVAGASLRSVLLGKKILAINIQMQLNEKDKND